MEKNTKSDRNRRSSYRPILDLRWATGDAFGELYRISTRAASSRVCPGRPTSSSTASPRSPSPEDPARRMRNQVRRAAGGVYFADDRQARCVAVLLEIALATLRWPTPTWARRDSEVDVSFRNLGGSATQFVRVLPASGTLTVRVKLTRASSSAGMIIQFFDYEVLVGRDRLQRRHLLRFFPKAALAKQEWLRIRAHLPSADDSRAAAAWISRRTRRSRRPLRSSTASRPGSRTGAQQSATSAPHGASPRTMVLQGAFHQDGGAGFARPGIVPAAVGSSPPSAGGRAFETVVTGERHEWIYRGQVIRPIKKSRSRRSSPRGRCATLIRADAICL